mmetsp:Transcript_18161/g.38373  ORF Transcript_18161/g.38373 Transcript_18161/m.38373 type:complete len:81 (+) Transcript_18161:1220-1462(+)
MALVCSQRAVTMRCLMQEAVLYVDQDMNCCSSGLLWISSWCSCVADPRWYLDPPQARDAHMGNPPEASPFWMQWAGMVEM